MEVPTPDVGDTGKLGVDSAENNFAKTLHTYDQKAYIDMVNRHTQICPGNIDRYCQKTYTDVVKKHTSI